MFFSKLSISLKKKRYNIQGACLRRWLAKVRVKKEDSGTVAPSESQENASLVGVARRSRVLVDKEELTLTSLDPVKSSTCPGLLLRMRRSM